MRAPGTGQMLWADKLTNAKVDFGPVARGTRRYLSLQYTDVVRPNYTWPSRGEFIQAELLVDGKKVKGILLNADSFGNSANYFLTDEHQTNLVPEVVI